jgi:hypothetical protein
LKERFLPVAGLKTQIGYNPLKIVYTVYKRSLSSQKLLYESAALHPTARDFKDDRSGAPNGQRAIAA